MLDISMTLTPSINLRGLSFATCCWIQMTYIPTVWLFVSIADLVLNRSLLLA